MDNAKRARDLQRATCDSRPATIPCHNENQEFPCPVLSAKNEKKSAFAWLFTGASARNAAVSNERSRSIARALASSGLHYESPVTSLSQQAITAEVQQMLKEYREAEQKHLGYTRLRDADVLRAFVFLLRMGTTRTSGRPKSRAFVEFLFRQFPEQQTTVASPARSSIIVP